MARTKDKYIILDMDGTIADLYGVENWLECLQNEDSAPYEQAEPLYPPTELIAVLMQLKSKGYKLGIISWLSKGGTPHFNKEVRKAKRKWLADMELLPLFDSVRIVPYGKNKSVVAHSISEYGILVDDELRNREKWKLGATIDANKDIIKALRGLL